MHLGKPILLRAIEHIVRGLVEFGGGRYPVQARQRAQVFIRGDAAGLMTQRRPVGIRQEGVLRPRQGGA